jgi:hypothetical protein
MPIQRDLQTESGALESRVVSFAEYMILWPGHFTKPLRSTTLDLWYGA